MENSVAGVIVMGGLNTRMNGNKKAFLEYKGEKFYKHICKAFESVEKIYLSVENDEAYKDLGYELIIDEFKEIGPIGGIYSSINFCKEDAIFILPSDTPLIKKEMIDKMIEKYRMFDTNIVLSENGKEHPLIAIYKREIIEIVKKNIELGNYKVRDILKEIDYVTITLEEMEIKEESIRGFNDLENYHNLIREE